MDNGQNPHQKGYSRDSNRWHTLCKAPAQQFGLDSCHCYMMQARIVHLGPFTVPFEKPFVPISEFKCLVKH